MTDPISIPANASLTVDRQHHNQTQSNPRPVLSGDVNVLSQFGKKSFDVFPKFPKH
ncbi:MAG: hypothetical protein ACFE0I_21965 [Elainellaceae cyanobacterium]